MDRGTSYGRRMSYYVLGKNYDAIQIIVQHCINLLVAKDFIVRVVLLLLELVTFMPAQIKLHGYFMGIKEIHIEQDCLPDNRIERGLSRDGVVGMGVERWNSSRSNHHDIPDLMTSCGQCRD